VTASRTLGDDAHVRVRARAPARAPCLHQAPRSRVR
jgi:hypothetical protein